MTDPFDRIVIGLEWIVWTSAAGTDYQRLNIPGGALHEQTDKVGSKGFLHLPTSDARIIGRYRVVLANHVGVAGVIHDQAACPTFQVFNFDNPDLRVNRSERNPVWVLAQVMIVRDPGFPGMPILANDQPIEPQLRETPVSRGNARREHALHGRAHSLKNLLLVEILVAAARVGMRMR